MSIDSSISQQKWPFYWYHKAQAIETWNAFTDCDGGRINWQSKGFKSNVNVHPLTVFFFAQYDYQLNGIELAQLDIFTVAVYGLPYLHRQTQFNFF